ncbi:hypothetical protein NP493_542g00013 [Ridgeia piscesae]|uniref:Uncharacterized protein n=1 Tax=Ridgeia piscesae TaxID=27915 RepID=A0AAD9KX21_RIDPI|nr:hypothetical protein NP493_542g00013 [Ridgeia piscesae]
MDVESGAQDVRSRESSCCSPPSPSPPPREIQNAACRHDHRRSQICRRQHHASIHASAGAITIAVQFVPKRGIDKTRCCSPPSASLPQIRNAA